MNYFEGRNKKYIKNYKFMYKFFMFLLIICIIIFLFIIIYIFLYFIYYSSRLFWLSLQFLYLVSPRFDRPTNYHGSARLEPSHKNLWLELGLAQYNFRAEPEPDPGSAQAGSCGALAKS